MLFSLHSVLLIFQVFLTLCNSILYKNKHLPLKGNILLNHLQVLQAILWFIAFSIYLFFLFKQASQRIVNPIRSNKKYPWLACLLIQEQKKPNLQEESKPEFCTGSVISKRYSCETFDYLEGQPFQHEVG